MAMVTCPEWISGKGNFIDCMHGGSLPDDVINRYCYIQVDNFYPHPHKKNQQTTLAIARQGNNWWYPSFLWTLVQLFWCILQSWHKDCHWFAILGNVHSTTSCNRERNTQRGGPGQSWERQFAGYKTAVIIWPHSGFKLQTAWKIFSTTMTQLWFQTGFLILVAALISAWQACRTHRVKNLNVFYKKYQKLG